MCGDEGIRGFNGTGVVGVLFSSTAVEDSEGDKTGRSSSEIRNA